MISLDAITIYVENSLYDNEGTKGSILQYKVGEDGTKSITVNPDSRFVRIKAEGTKEFIVNGFPFSGVKN